MEDNKEIKIKVSNLKKSFGSLEVLKDISTEVTKGEVVCVIGPSGSGKSTFLRCLNKLEKVTAGTIIIDGNDITSKQVNINHVRENIGMVFQHFNLFNNLNILDNLTLAPVQLKKCSKAEAVTRAKNMLKKVGLEDKSESYPSQLSGGQKQRVAIARAMITRPKILLADEPTGALDSATGKQVMELFSRINKDQGTTVIIVTHDPGIGASTERCIRILDGKIVEG